MGASLSEPVTKRSTESCANELYKVGSSSMQGWRISMEDAHIQLLAMPEDEGLSFFGVYDGHGGAAVARYASYYLHKRIVQSKAYEEGRIADAIREGYLLTDEEIFHREDNAGHMTGTTAVVVLIKDGVLYCRKFLVNLVGVDKLLFQGNVGDSRAVVSSDGFARPLTVDHKPINELEIKRIIAAGGWVEFNRVNGNLAMSRALGDFMYKRNDEKPAEEQIVIGVTFSSHPCQFFFQIKLLAAVPDVCCWHLSDKDEFVVLACDGIWDVLSNQEVVDFCRERIAVEKEPDVICEELLTRCLAPDCQMGGLGCDNMTVILVCLIQNRPYKSLALKCAQPRPSSAPDKDGQPVWIYGSCPEEEETTILCDLLPVGDQSLVSAQEEVTYVLNGEGEHGIALPVAVAHISREVQQTDRLSSESCVETLEIAGTYPISAGQNVADTEEGDKNVDACTGCTRC
ncbi:protein phosphatase 2C [Trichuris trichiura]|uniref:protein-serine/threonine phosphatase n=1 Tax=Trichuris trichiura TaxID=36087 RepID=A0A077Z8C2_TRITR|nr:protein phosphatase 2C [Trichuris trichiura]